MTRRQNTDPEMPGHRSRSLGGDHDHKHAFYLKPGEKKRVKQALARKRARKKIRRQPNEDR
jgi:hypothetical protein